MFYRWLMKRAKQDDGNRGKWATAKVAPIQGVAEKLPDYVEKR